MAGAAGNEYKLIRLSLNNMKIPSKIKIGAIWWKIKEVEPTELDIENETCGDQAETTQLIRINRSLSKEMKELTLLHEVLHCIDGQLDHNLVELLSSSLHQVISENKLFRE